jgi:Na+/proline symporter
MDIIFFIIFMALFIGMFSIIGFFGYKKTKTAEDYFVAGRKMGSIVIAFSYGATFISAVALIGFSGIASLYGHALLWLALLNILVGILIAFVVYGFRTRKMGLSLKAVTLPEMLGNRFNSTRLQATSGLIIAIFMIAYTSAVFLAISSLFVVTFGIPYEICVVIFTVVVGIYLIVGGLYAVMWTHAIQGALMVVGMLILTVGIYGMLGGVGPAHEAAADMTPIELGVPLGIGTASNPWNFSTGTLAIDKVSNFNPNAAGFSIDTINPPDGQINVDVGQNIIIHFSNRAAPNTKQVSDRFKYTCSPDPGGWTEEWNENYTQATLSHNDFQSGKTYTFEVTDAISGLGSPAGTLAPSGLTSMPPMPSPPFLMLLTLIFGVGIGVLAQPQLVVRYLSAKSEKALKKAIPYGGIFILLMTFTAFSIGPLCNVLMAENGLFYPGTPDMVVPLVIEEVFPQWFVFLFLFAVLSAAMSTASALFHTAGASIGRDVYEKGMKKKGSEKKSLKITRVATLGIVIATLIISLNPPDVVAIMTAFFFGLMAVTFLAPYTLMLYWKKTSKAGAWAGMLGGFIFTMFWYVLIYFKTAPQIIGSSMIDNYMVNMLDPIFIGLPVSFVLTYIFSILMKQDKDEQKLMKKSFENI